MTAPGRSLLPRLVWSHAGLTALVAFCAALTLYAGYFLLEDRAFGSVVRASVERARDGAQAPLGAWRLDGAPDELRAATADLPDGVHELEREGVERHVALATDEAGVRWVAVLEAGEVERDRWLAAGLAGSVLLLSLLAVGVGYAVARRTLAPLERLAGQLRPGATPPSPAALRRDTSNDEVGLLADRLAHFLDERENALAREREFLRDASHELRNPLTVLQGAIALVRDEGTPDSARLGDRLGRMDRSVLRMRRTVEELLTLARQESEAAPAADRPLTDAVEELLDELRSGAARGVELRLNASGEPAGPTPLWLVLLRNLVDNALAATDRGSVEVQLASDRVAVRDTGRGMAPELLRSGTDAFVRGDGGTGFGLGLAIVKRLADRLGWALRIESGGSAGGTVVELVRGD
ncbi:MAG: HAMP domain-containing sensor histidine kinase [Planctomycetota bacterium]